MNLRTIIFPIACAAILVADTPGATPPKPPSNGAIGPVAFQTFAASTYLYLSAQTTQAKLPTLVPAMAKRLETIQREAGLQVSGPLLMIQRGASEDPVKPFDLEVGVLVPEGTKPRGDAKVRALPVFPCATTLVSGDAAGETGKAAFMALFKAAGEQGRIPTGEFRERLLFWEHEGSANNLLQVQVGLH